MGFAKENIYDLAFVGSGSLHLLYFTFIDTGACTAKSKVKILVIDKADEFWVGIPYGNRSGFNSLIITSLKDFLQLMNSSFLKV
jgi:uncharacterized NAD(P)/FAD-binding protein YdhS